MCRRFCFKNQPDVSDVSDVSDKHGQTRTFFAAIRACPFVVLCVVSIVVLYIFLCVLFAPRSRDFFRLFFFFSLKFPRGIPLSKAETNETFAIPAQLP